MSLFVGDFETGEVIYKIEENKSIHIDDYFTKQRNKLSRKHFYKVYKGSIYAFSKDYMNYQTLIVLFKLIKLLVFNSQFVVINGIPANIETICKYLKIHRRTFENYVRKLEKMDILKRVKGSRSAREREIMINPYFISYGTATNESLKQFKNSKWYKEVNRKQGWF